MKVRRLRTGTKFFLLMLAATTTIWVLRGIGLLTFIPGWVIWVTLLVTIGSAVLDGIQGTRR